MFDYLQHSWTHQQRNYVILTPGKNLQPLYFRDPCVSPVQYPVARKSLILVAVLCLILEVRSALTQHST